MAKQEECEECKKGLPGWMATFSDMVTLLMTFFVMLMAMASFEEGQKIDAVVDSIQMRFGLNGYIQHSTPDMESVEWSNSTTTVQPMSPLRAKIRESFKKHVSDQMIRIVDKEQEIRLVLDERVFFRPGSSKVNPAAFPALSDIASALKDKEVQIKVEGHTDATGKAQENWNLSADRAASVVSVLMRRGVEGKRLSAVGHGQFKPGVAFGEDPSWNRRIELVIRGQDLGALQLLDDAGDSARP